jgi:urease alpha subunit
MAQFDVVIKDGMVFDGRRNPRFRGDVGIKDGRIAEVGLAHDEAGAFSMDRRCMNPIMALSMTLAGPVAMKPPRRIAASISK